MTSWSDSLIFVGLPASQSASSAAAAARVRLQFPWPSWASGSGPTGEMLSSQPDPLDFRWLTLTVTRPPVPFSTNV